MQNWHDFEGEVVSAVKGFADSINYSKGTVVADMSQLIEVTSQLPLSNLDYWERLIRSEFSNGLYPSTKANWKFWSKPSELLTWLDLISWDGYRREKTLRTIRGAAPNSFFFALAVRRLNDWVPQVREAAREKLPLIVEESNPAHIAEALCITLPNWNSWGRIEEVDKQVLLKIMSKKDIGNQLKSTIISSVSGPMAFLLAQIGRSPVLDDYLHEIASQAIQPSVRAKAYRSQFEERIVWLEGRKWEWTDIRYCEGRVSPIVGERKIRVAIDFRGLLHSSATDSSSIVRRVAAEFLIRELDSLGDESSKYANLFASDKSSPVAERGKFALRKLKEIKA